MRTKAILFIFQSELPITESALADLGERMTRHFGISGDIDTTVYSPEEISNLLVTNAKKQAPKISFEENKLNPAENAIVFIGTKMREDLVNYVGKAAFKNAVMEKAEELLSSDAKMYTAFTKAMRELSRNNIEVSSSLMRKYHFSKEKVFVIKTCYDELFGV